MHGIIFAELKKYVDSRLGGKAWPTVLREAGIADRIFLTFQEYPDSDAATLVTTAAQIAGKPVQAILEDFGEFIAPDLLGMYASLIPKEWRTLDVLMNTEDTIHQVVRRRNPGARPPELRSVRRGPDEVVVHYASPRRMCAVAKGIVRGVAKHFDETVTITEPECMLIGGKECRLSVRLTL